MSLLTKGLNRIKTPSTVKGSLEHMPNYGLDEGGHLDIPFVLFCHDAILLRSYRDSVLVGLLNPSLLPYPLSLWILMEHLDALYVCLRDPGPFPFCLMKSLANSAALHSSWCCRVVVLVCCIDPRRDAHIFTVGRFVSLRILFWN